MAADLYKMQDDQRFPEIRIDKPEFVKTFYSQTAAHPLHRILGYHDLAHTVRGNDSKDL